MLASSIHRPVDICTALGWAAAAGAAGNSLWISCHKHLKKKTAPFFFVVVVVIVVSSKCLCKKGGISM